MENTFDVRLGSTAGNEQLGKTKVVIVGSGIYGISTALYMLKDGKYDVTVLDKCEVLPAPDAASTGESTSVGGNPADGPDINKIIRAGDYADPQLSHLAIEAVELWKQPEWEGTYHETGVFCLSSESSSSGRHFVESAYTNCIANNLPCQKLQSSAEIRRALNEQTSVPVGAFDGRIGYRNPTGGWAESGRALDVGIKRVRQAGGEVRAGAEVVGLVKQGRQVEGVRLKSGEEVLGDLVVITAGAWTPSLCATEGISARLPDVVATGQSLATIQLTPEEVDRYSHNPVIFNLDTGFYVFPPNPDGLIKVAIHGAGYTNPIGASAAGSDEKTSVPQTKLTPAGEKGMVPKEMLKQLREGLEGHYPEFKGRDFVSSRLCWYADTPTGDWLIDYHPEYDNLFVATGDSGHAFKFTPNIGREILRIIQRKGDPEYTRRWAFGGNPSACADERSGVRQVLKQDGLATPDDLRGTA